MTIDAALLFNAIGLTGTVLYIGSYALLQFGLIRGSSLTYTLMNLAAACCVLISLSATFNLSSALIQSSWIVISVVGLLRLWLLSHRARFTEEEAELISGALPFLSKPAARKFLDAGRWQEVPAGTVLARIGEPVPGLHYISRGTAQVRLGGEIIANVGKGSFIGEMTVLSADPASADVVAASDLRHFIIVRETLVRMCDRDENLRQNIEFALGRDTRAKLIATNSALRARLG
ncbi:cyclic nucleotide-binding domain-containing protein [Roseisalinus antarcticus]|uniref:Cyclic nucleotide-gated potassium channel n=1 Tax=Roseisalinus antarcticus TaxID=254357 RepID=A0A1Y5RQF9_9RHOB|nr:cyclic nucleotide-binding domain-containing protein [Roseisalinus antarcticus]SLN22822.1 Cyclic nucleotide-gated potassium channel [Roseisalinus antarcticus]